MDINKVIFGDFSLPSKRENSGKKEEKEEVINTAPAMEAKNVDGAKVLDALDMAGIQNKLQVSKSEKVLNPSDYLSEDRISDIEAMMGKFEDGVGAVTDAIEEEFPGFFAEDTKLALGARIFAQE